MTLAGRSVYKGINAQSWAAISLFLQYIGRSDFDFIRFEGEKLKDFHLVFLDSNKIVCESKASVLTYTIIRDELATLYKDQVIDSGNEILFICQRVSKGLKSDFEHFKYFPEIKKKIISKGVPEEFVGSIRIWEVTKEMNQDSAKLLLADLLRFWVPDTELDRLLKTLVLDNVYEGSEVGAILTKKEFIESLDRFKEEVKSRVGVFDDEKKQKLAEIESVIHSSRDPKSSQWTIVSVQALTTTPDLLMLSLSRLEKEDQLELRQWHTLWTACFESGFFRFLNSIFEKNISSTADQEYVLEFLVSQISNRRNFFQDEFARYEMVKLGKSISDQTRELDSKIFILAKKLLEPSIEEHFFVKHKRNERWEKDEVVELLEELFTRTSDVSFKEEIYKYVCESFNVVQDHGEYLLYAPAGIYHIMRYYLEENYLARLDGIIEVLSDQFKKYYSIYGLPYDGWEHEGPGIGQIGNEYSIHDRNFLTGIIQPGLKKLYDQAPEEAWQLLLKRFISKEEKEVSASRPDFLNRASVPILLDEFATGTRESEAFEILRALIEMRKGLAWKPDVIYQAVRDHVALTDEKKWQLVKVSLDKYGERPVNIFVEQIVSDLATRFHPEALNWLKTWSNNPEYTKGQIPGQGSLVDHVSKLIQNEKTFDFGLEMLRSFSQSETFIKTADSFEAYDIAKLVSSIISANYDEGVRLLRELSKNDAPPESHQIVYAAAINSVAAERHDLLKKLFDDVLQPELQNLGDTIVAIEKKYAHRGAREQFVQFAEKLAGAALFFEALHIVKIFINDSDPPRDGSNYPDDPSGTFNFHRQVEDGKVDITIQTVRAWCAWPLQKFVIEKGQTLIPEIVPLVKLLSTDPNYYVRVHACFPLMLLVRYRNAQIKGKRFIAEDVVTSIMEIAFQMLADEKNRHYPAILSKLGHVFGGVRDLDAKMALQVLSVFSQEPRALKEVIPLFIYYAEFRKDYESGFDDSEVRKLFLQTIEHSPDDLQSTIAWHFAELGTSEEQKGREVPKKNFEIAARYLMILANNYSHHKFHQIYRFIREEIDKPGFFQTCFRLWIKCLEVERAFFQENTANLQNIYHWPYYETGEILLEVAKQAGNDEFLTRLEFLADYPKEIPLDLSKPVKKLKELPYGSRGDAIFRKIVEQNPYFYDDYNEWQQKGNMKASPRKNAVRAKSGKIKNRRKSKGINNKKTL